MTVRTVLVALLIVVSLSIYSVWRTLEVPDSGPASPIDRTGSDWAIPRVGSDRYLVLLMIDGLTDDALQTALDDGRMPNLAALLANRPTAAMTAISTFPSATSPSVQELLSGRFAEMDYLSTPGAVHAFDREERHVVRYITMPDAWQWPVPTILDAVPGRQVVTVFEGRWDGPTTILTQYNMASQAILASLGASALSHGDAGPVRAYVELIDSGERPAVSLVVLNEFDVAAHFHGPDSPEAQAALRGCDERIGEIVRSLQRNQSPSGASLLPNTVFAIFGDHG